MNVILDTNVLVSGIFFKGPPFEILIAWKNGKFRLVVSHAILEEYRRVINEISEEHPSINTSGIIDKIAINSFLTFSINLPEQICIDPDDDKFIATAITSRTKIIISGDKHLLVKSGYAGIKVIKPRDFLQFYLLVK